MTIHYARLFGSGGSLDRGLYSSLSLNGPSGLHPSSRHARQAERPLAHATARVASAAALDSNGSKEENGDGRELHGDWLEELVG